MATVKWTGLITDMRGTVGGMTFGQVRGQYIARAKPIQPKRNTVKQATQRNYLVSGNNAWQNLSEAQKDAWRTFAASPPETDYDAFGDVILISGYNWFQRINARLGLVGQDMVITPPVGSRPNLPTALSCELYAEPGTTCTVLTDIAEWDDTDYCVIYAGTTTLATSTTYISGDTFQCAILAADYGAFDFTSAFLNNFGIPKINQPARIVVVRQKANGLRSLQWVSLQQFGSY